MKRYANRESDAVNTYDNLRTHLNDWYWLLSETEQRNVAAYCEKWQKHHESDAFRDDTAVSRCNGFSRCFLISVKL